jgi:hypothetical protein
MEPSEVLKFTITSEINSSSLILNFATDVQWATPSPLSRGSQSGINEGESFQTRTPRYPTNCQRRNAKEKESVGTSNSNAQTYKNY